MSQLEKFGSYDKGAAEKAIKDEEKVGWFKPKPGTNLIRFLPPLVGMAEPWVTIYQHFIKMKTGELAVFNCPRRMSNARCPGCEKAEALKANNNPVDEAAAKLLWPKQRNLALIIDRDDMEKGIQVYSFGYSIKVRLRYFRAKLNRDYPNLITGNDVLIDRKGQGLDTEYQVDLGSQGPLLDDMTGFEQLAERMPDLEEMAKVLSYDEIIEKFKPKGAPAVAPTRAVAAIDASDDYVDMEDDLPY